MCKVWTNHNRASYIGPGPHTVSGSFSSRWWNKMAKDKWIHCCGTTGIGVFQKFMQMSSPSNYIAANAFPIETLRTKKVIYRQICVNLCFIASVLSILLNVNIIILNVCSTSRSEFSRYESPPWPHPLLLKHSSIHILPKSRSLEAECQPCSPPQRGIQKVSVLLTPPKKVSNNPAMSFLF